MNIPVGKTLGAAEKGTADAAQDGRIRDSHGRVIAGRDSPSPLS
jgi:hypothetical protein